MKILKIEIADSTNNWVAQHESELPSPSLVYCHQQTAGRGQRGNSWESEPGKNITASLIFHPEEFPAYLQFSISEAIALAIVDFLNDYGVKAQIKWPNDIYVGEKKICGILVEHVVSGQNIARSIAGFGININQTCFISDAPNPVSLSLLTGQQYNLEELTENLAAHLEKNLTLLHNAEDCHSRFTSNLWRKDGNYHQFYDHTKKQHIKAFIHDVANNGMLTLITKENEARKYAFKEVEFIL